MLKEEEFNKVFEGFKKAFEDNGIIEGLVYSADLTIKSNNGEAKIPNIAFGVNKFPYAVYPHIEAKLISENYQEAATVAFVDPENFGDPIEAMQIDNLTNERTNILNISDFSKFLKESKKGEIRKELYLNEKKTIEAALKQVNEILEKAGIKES